MSGEIALICAMETIMIYGVWRVILSRIISLLIWREIKIVVSVL
jgi:hypothetical protein